MKLKDYTVVGFWADNQQPWAQWVKALNPREAASLAVWEISKSEYDPDDAFVVEVLVGHHKCVLGDDEVVSGAKAKKVILENKKDLARFLHITPDLDEAIEKALNPVPEMEIEYEVPDDTCPSCIDGKIGKRTCWNCGGSGKLKT